MLVFNFMVFVLGLVTQGEGGGVTPPDDCIASGPDDDKVVLDTFSDDVDFLISDAKTVRVQHSSGTCIFDVKQSTASDTWSSVVIKMNNTVTMEINNSSVEGKEYCTARSNGINIKRITIEKKDDDFKVFRCNNGPVVFQVWKEMTIDDMVIPWHEDSVNISMTPDVNTLITVIIGGEHNLSVCNDEEQACETVSEETMVYVKKHSTNYTVTVGGKEFLKTTKSAVETVKVKKNDLKGVLIIKQSLGNPASQEQVQPSTTTTSTTEEFKDPCSSATQEPVSSTCIPDGEDSNPGKEPYNKYWIYAGIPLAFLLGIVLGVFLTAALKCSCKNRPATGRILDVQRSRSTEDGVVSTINDLYEPLEEYRTSGRTNDTIAGPNSPRTDEGSNEIINDLYESVDNVLSPSRKHH